jgi:beta-glucanase (GH16 family)
MADTITIEGDALVVKDARGNVVYQTGGTTPIPPEPSGANLLFEDEFKNGLDLTKWKIVITNNWAVSKPPVGSWDCNEFVDWNVHVHDDLLHLYCNKGPSPAGRPYTAGMVCSTGTWRYGYWEASCKCPAGGVQGIWPAFWMNVKNTASAWGTYPEIDAMEWLGSRKTRCYFNLHLGSSQHYGTNLEVGDQQAAFHSYGIDWTEQKIDYYFDRRLVFTLPSSQQPNATSPSSAMQILLDNTVGGWDGNEQPDGQTVFPSDFVVDWVRVWDRKPF